jgi:hypothetical protein
VTVDAAAGNMVVLHCLMDGVDTLDLGGGTANIENLAGTDQTMTDSAGNTVTTAAFFVGVCPA